MKKRILSLILVLSMLLGPLPAAAFTVEEFYNKKFGITLAPAADCYAYHGEDMSIFNVTPDGEFRGSRGAYCNEGDVYVHAWGNNEQQGGLRIEAMERAHFKNADYLLQPFTINVKVPAHTIYSIDYDVYAHVQRNSKGKVWYWLELFKGKDQTDTFSARANYYSTQNNSTKSNEYSVGRSSYSDRDGGTVKYTFTLTFDNSAGTEEAAIRYPMAYYVGASRSGSILESYFHQTESYMEFYETERREIKSAATVSAGGKTQGYPSLSGAVEAYNAADNATLTLLQADLEGDMALTKPGTVDLGGHELEGAITTAADGAITVQNGRVTSKKNAITNNGPGTLTLKNLEANNISNAYGVKNNAGTLTVDNTVTIEPTLYAGGGAVHFNGGGPTILAAAGGYHITLKTPVTLGAALEKRYTVSMSEGKATTNWPGNEDPESHFTDSKGVNHFFKDADGSVMARPYKIVFDANGGEVSRTSTYVKKNGAAAVLPTPTRSGYTFLGWKDGDTEVTSTTKFTGDATLTAQWEEKADVKVTVAYDLNYEGGTAPAAQTVSVDKPYGELPVPTRENYTFDGWFTEAAGGVQVKSSTIVTRAADHTLYAHWTRQTVTVTFNYNYDGASQFTRTVNKGEALGALPGASRKGYTFEGWFTAATGGTAVTDATVPEGWPTYYAHWAAKTFTVSLDPNGGTVSPADKNVTEGDPYGELPTPERPGYDFLGWFKPGADTAVENTDAVTASHTLSARWKAKTFTVTFDGNEGTVSATSMTVTYDKTYGEGTGLTDGKLPVPTRSGNTFIGWYTKDGKTGGDYGELIAAATAVKITADQTLYARWASDHQHTLNGTGETVAFSQTLDQNDFNNAKNNEGTSIKGLTYSSGGYKLATGSYCLTGDIGSESSPIGGILICNGVQVDLCLNGHTITSSGGLQVEGERTTLDLCDCQGKGGVTTTSRGYCLDIEGSTVGLYGGTFTSSADCVELTALGSAGGTLTVEGATLKSTNERALYVNAECKATIRSGTLEGSQYGAYVMGSTTDINRYGTLNVQGGSITGGEYYGISTNGHTNVSGGVITGKRGGINSKSGVLTVTGGTISSEGDYGVSNSSNDPINLGGSPTIQGAKGSFYLNSAYGIDITGDLQGVFSVDLEASYAPTEGRSYHISYANAADESAHFTAVNPLYGIKNDETDNSVLLCLASEVSGGTGGTVSSEHQHPLCGLTCTHGEHGEDLAWEELTADTSKLENGKSYYLKEDLTLTGALSIPTRATVNLCLNGHILSSSAENVIKVGDEGTLNLCDCSQAKTGTVKTTSTSSIAFTVSFVNHSDCVLNQYGGKLSAPQNPIYSPLSNTWNFYGGALEASNAGSTPTIQLNTNTIKLNLLGSDIDMGGGRIEIQRLKSSSTPMQIGAKPQQPYKVYLNPGSTTDIACPVTIAAGLPSGAALNECFDLTVTNSAYGSYCKAKLAYEDGEVILRYYKITVDGMGVYTADNTGYLSSGNRTAINTSVTRDGYTFDGFYTQPDGGGSKVDISKKFTDDATLYPKWTRAEEPPCDHSGNTSQKTTVEATCTDPGCTSFTCSVCGATVIEEIAAKGHAFDESVWAKDENEHWHACTVCGERKDAAEHTWDAGVKSGGKMTYTCSACSQTREEALTAFAVSYVLDRCTTRHNTATEAATKYEGDAFTLPTGSDVSRTGYTLAGWVLLDEYGVPTGAPLTGTFTMPDRNVILQISWTRIPDYALQPGETVTLEDGTTVTNDNGTVTITQPGGRDENGNEIDGQTTEIGLPGGSGSVTITAGTDGEKDTIEAPAGSTVQTGDGPTITIGDGDSGQVDTSGTVDAPAGSTVTDGSTTVTIPDGSGTIGSDGNVTFPDGQSGTVTVTDPDGKTETVTVDGETEGLDVSTGEAPPYSDEDDKVQIGDTVITMPTDPVTGKTDPATGGVTKNEDDGSITVPGGSTVQTGDGPAITLPDGDEGGKVNEQGEITVPPGSSVTIPDGEGGSTTITVPDGDTPGTIKPGTDGSVELPGGSTVTKPDGTTDKVPEGGGTITPSGGTSGDGKLDKGETIDLGGGGKIERDGDTITITDPDGAKTIVTLPAGTGAIDVNETTGEIDVPGGSTVKTGENGPTITLPDGGAGGTVKPGGEVGGSPVKVGDATVTVTDPTGGKVTVDKDGNVTVPGGATADVDKESDGTTDATVTVPAGGTGTVKPNGDIELPKDGTATIPGGSGKPDTIITAGDQGGTVSTDPQGSTTVPSGSTVQTGDSPEIALPNGGTVDKDGNVTGSPVKVGDTTVTAPDSQTVTTGPDGSATVPDGTTVQTGNGPEIALPNGGTVDKDGNVTGNPVKVGDTTVTVTVPTDGKATVDKDGNVTLPGGSTATVDKGSDGKTDTTVTVPAGGGSGTVKPDGGIELPEGGTVQVGAKPVMTITPPSGGEVKPGENGEVTVPGGSTVTIPDGKGGTTTISVPDGGEVKSNGDDTVDVPGGSTVKKPDGSSGGTVPDGGGTVTIDGEILGNTPGPEEPTEVKPGTTVDLPGGSTVKGEDDGTVTITDKDGTTTTVTSPADKTVTVDETTGEIDVPGGSTVQTGSGPVVTLPDGGEGGTVKPGGEVSGSPVKVGDTTVTVTKPAVGTVTADKDGNVTVPGGTTADVDQDGDGTPDATVTVPTGGESGTVQPGGDIDLPEGGTVQTGDGPEIALPNGGTVDESGNVTGNPVKVGDTTITAPDGQDVTTGPDGSTTVPGGTTVQTGDGPKIALPDGGKVDGDGSTTIPAGGSATVDDGTGSKTTITVPAGGGDGTIDPDGEAEVPDGSKVQTGGGTEIAVGPGNPGTVGPDGSVTVPGGGSVTIPDGEGGPTKITVPGDAPGTIKPDTDGSVEVPGGSTVTKPDGTTDKVPEGGTGIVSPGGEITGGSTTLEPGDSVTTTGGVTVTNKDDGTVTITDKDGTTTTVTLPGTGDVTVDQKTGEVAIPGGSTVKTGDDGAEIELPSDGEGGTVAPGGEVSGSPVKVGDTTVTVTKPANGTVTADKDGNVTVPGGTTADVDQDDDGTTDATVTVPTGDESGTVQPGGDIDLPAGGTVQTDSGPEIALPNGGTVDESGNVTGNPVKVGDTTITAPDGQDVTTGPDGSTTIPAGGSATVDDGTGSKTTITVPVGGGDGTIDPDGETTVPGGTTVQTGENGPEITVPDGTKVGPDGIIKLPEGGESEISISDGTNTTEIAVPGGSTVAPNDDGTVTLPDGGTVQTDNGPENAAPGSKVSPNGTITPPEGDREKIHIGNITIVLPEGKTSEDVTDTDGTVTIPEGSEVQAGGTEIVVPDGTKVGPDGIIKLPDGGESKIAISNGTDTTEIILPDDNKTVTPNHDGSVTVPDGSEVKKPNGESELVPGGGAQVKPDGTVTPIIPPAHTHTWATTWTSDKDYHWHECTTGGCSITDSQKSGYAAHSENSGIVIKAATAGEPGLRRYQCVDCLRILRTETIPALGFEISGTVTQDGGPASDATVTLRQGNNKIGEKTTDEQGYYSFPAVPPGTYNVVGEKDGKTVTQLVVLTVENATLNLQMPGEQVNSILEVKDDVSTGDGSAADVGKTVVGNLDEEAVAQKVDAATVTITMTVEKKADAGSEDQTAIKDLVAADPGGTSTEKKLEFLAITITKEVKTEQDTASEELKETREIIEIVIPYDFSGKKDVTVYRYHVDDENNASTERLTPGSGSEGTFTLDEANGLIYIYAKKFSTYAITSTQVEDEGDTVYTLTVNGGQGSGTYKAGETVFISAQVPSGQMFDRWNASGGGIVFSAHQNGYTFTMPARSLTVTAQFQNIWSGDDDDDSPTEPTYRPTVEKTSHGTVTVRPTAPEQGDRVTIAVKPDEGYEVEKVTVTDRNGDAVKIQDNGDGTYTFTQPKGKVTIAATFQAVAPVQPVDGYAACPKDRTCPIWPFPDASTMAWYHDGVHYCLEHGLMSGYGDGRFGPSDSMSRAMLAQILYNQAGRPDPSGSSPFEDVAPDAWYADAVTWAAAKGIVSGYGDGRFGPNDNITREQLATMLWKYAVSPTGAGTLDSFTDRSKVSKWAVDALRWAVEQGLISGKGGGILDPGGEATRAEAATMLMHYLENIEKQ